VPDSFSSWAALPITNNQFTQTSMITFSIFYLLCSKVTDTGSFCVFWHEHNHELNHSLISMPGS